MRNWLVLVKERFNPAAYLPMILVFTIANGLYLTEALLANFPWQRAALVIILMLSFFFRMRCFDEIKDYEVDLKINPSRPLARGVLSVSQVKKGLFFLILFELILAGYLGFWPFIIHSLAVLYSLLMYEEFFIGDWLRPHLTTYAVTHTFVSVLLGLSAAVAISSYDIRQLDGEDAAFFLMNWAFFNLFEFARKTFAPEEERPAVPSYSNIFTPRGAWFLSWSQVLLGIGFLLYSFADDLSVHWIALGAVAYTFLSVGYLVRPQKGPAKAFRSVAGSYLLAHYILICFALGV